MHPLVDAFIKGRAKFKKTTGEYFDKKGKAACHLGAMYWGYYNKSDATMADMRGLLFPDFPELYQEGKYVPLPCDDVPKEEGHITSILVHLNDAHDGRSGWTDQAVANWLEKALEQVS